MTLQEQIQQQYPHPESARHSLAESTADVEARQATTYCILGAVCLFYGTERITNPRFPDPEEMAAVLVDLNPILDREQARMLAEDISWHNDNKHFDLAWALLGHALWRGGEEA